MTVKDLHISPEDRRGWICTKFCTSGRLADLITRDNFLAIGLGVLIPRRVELPFSYLQPVAVNTVLALTCSP